MVLVLGKQDKPEALKIEMCWHSACANIHACFSLHKICTITDFQNMQCQTHHHHPGLKYKNTKKPQDE
jgi:hypothetical protein